MVHHSSQLQTHHMAVYVKIISFDLKNQTHCFKQGVYKLSEYFAKPYFHKYWTKIHDVTTIWKRNVCSFIVTLNAIDVRPCVPQNCYIVQIPGHTNYAQSVRQPFPSNTGFRFSRKMAVATIGPSQILRSLCVIDMNFTILRHFLLKLWHNEILW
jgi:hypothetical protein